VSAGEKKTGRDVPLTGSIKSVFVDLQKKLLVALCAESPTLCHQ
jgi:hypothetical protein